MNSNTNIPENVELIQFIREKGERIVACDEHGKPMEGKNGKVAYVRKKGNPRGILIAKKVDGTVMIGWSFTNTKLDHFDKAKGLKIARGRLTKPSYVDRVPHAVFKEIESGFAERCEKYFKVSLE